MEDILVPTLVFFMIFIGLPWLVLHYVMRWKTAATITSDDEALLEELYSLAKRLDERMDTVERLVAADDPAFNPVRRIRADHDTDAHRLQELDRMMAEKKGTAA